MSHHSASGLPDDHVDEEFMRGVEHMMVTCAPSLGGGTTDDRALKDAMLLECTPAELRELAQRLRGVLAKRRETRGG